MVRTSKLQLDTNYIFFGSALMVFLYMVDAWYLQLGIDLFSLFSVELSKMNCKTRENKNQTGSQGMRGNTEGGSLHQTLFSFIF